MWRKNNLNQLMRASPELVKRNKSRSNGLAAPFQVYNPAKVNVYQPSRKNSSVTPVRQRMGDVPNVHEEFAYGAEDRRASQLILNNLSPVNRVRDAQAQFNIITVVNKQRSQEELKLEYKQQMKRNRAIKLLTRKKEKLEQRKSIEEAHFSLDRERADK